MITTTEKPTSTKPTSPQKSFSLEAFCAALSQWAEGLQMQVEQSINASDQNLGHLEELVLKDTKEIQRKAIEEAAQKKADTLRIAFYQPVRIVDTFYEPGPEATKRAPASLYKDAQPAIAMSPSDSQRNVPLLMMVRADHSQRGVDHRSSGLPF